MHVEAIETVVIGGGQAGLSVGYHLARRGAPFVILDAHRRVGDAWRKRWDSLRLFSPARFDGLDGMPFPAVPYTVPTKDQMANYLEAYADRFRLPVRSGVRVDRLARDGDAFLIEAGPHRLRAAQVVVAMANFQVARVPDFAPELREDIVQLHSSGYLNPGQLRPGGVLVVGAGNSGAEIASELVQAGHATWLSGRDVGQVPFRLAGSPARLVLARVIFRGVFHRVLTTSTPIGRKLRPTLLASATPLIRTKAKHLAAAGVLRVPRTTGARDGLPVLADGRVLEVANVVWCTGFEPGFSWIDLPVFDERGAPVHERGIAVGMPGLSFVGLHFQYAMSSSMIHGVGRDADYVAERIVAATRARRRTARAGTGAGLPVPATAQGAA